MVNQTRVRGRELGIRLNGIPGKYNAITDIEGVEVGHCTLIEGEGKLFRGVGPVRTGVTAILPCEKQYSKLFGAFNSLNGNGEMTGTAWIEESGYVEGPILITNTHSVGVARDAVIAWFFDEKILGSTKKQYFWSLPVVAETYDGFLNDINGFHVKKEHVYQALNSAQSGHVEEGNVGGGTGMICHQFKGGIGTSSRVISTNSGEYKVGVLVQANYGRREDLTITGVPVGREFAELMPEDRSEVKYNNTERGSIIVVVATNGPLLPHQLKRITRRVPMGLARVGSHGGNSSGDLFVAFSTYNQFEPSDMGLSNIDHIQNKDIDQFFLATVEATEEAIINAMISADTMEGINGNKVHSMPHDKLVTMLEKYNRI